MSLLNLNLSYQNIHFRHPSSSPVPLILPTLPFGISRSFIPTPLGELEILHTCPSPPHVSSSSQPPSLFFIHGGMGSASVWLEYLSFFKSLRHGDEKQRIPACYAVSMRGHGGSWYPSYLRMVYGTTKGGLAGDVVSGIRWAVDREREKRGLVEDEEEGGEGNKVDMVLVGHSSGGGLAQYILSAGLLNGLGVKIKGVVLMGAVPGFGSLSIYLNWLTLDPLFTLRLLLHGWHPNSPLSHPSLVRRIFFSHQLPKSYLLRFMSFMNRYESFLWPLGMGWRFADPEKVLLQISGWGETPARTPGDRQGQQGQQGQERMLVIAGEKDRIMTPDIMQRLVERYRSAYGRLVEGKKIDGVVRDTEEDIKGQGQGQEEGGKNTSTENSMGVMYAVVPGAGHHCQNDVGWEVGARKVLEFYRQLF